MNKSSPCKTCKCSAVTLLKKIKTCEYSVLFSVLFLIIIQEYYKGINICCTPN